MLSKVLDTRLARPALSALVGLLVRLAHPLWVLLLEPGILGIPSLHDIIGLVKINHVVVKILVLAIDEAVSEKVAPSRPGLVFAFGRKEVQIHGGRIRS